MWIAVVEIPIYMSQKDVIGGMTLSHTHKGMFFFSWIFFQNITNIIFGMYADKLSLKKSLFAANLFLILGYLIIVFAGNYLFFMSSVLFLGIGTAMFDLCTEGSFAYYSEKENSHKIWSNFILFINLAVVFSTIILIYLENISYQAVFISSVVFILCNLPLIYFLKEKERRNDTSISSISSLLELIKNKKLVYLTLIMSGFTLIYIQFYEMLPNYIFDWVDTSDIVKFFNLPDFMVSETSNGRMLSYQIIYLFSALLVIFFVRPFSNIFKNTNKINALIISLTLVALSCLIISSSQLSEFLFIGIIVYTFGEMLARPKFQETISSLSPKNRESQYLSFLHISYAIGYMIGTLSGGIIYDNFGEKAKLAQIELVNRFGINESLENSFNALTTKLNLPANELTQYLFNTYNPLLAWLPFVGILCVCIILLYFYNRKFN